MLRVFLFASSVVALSLGACSTTHSFPVAASKCEVQFHTAALVVAPLKESEVWREGDHDIVFESAIVPYAMDKFEDRQAILALRGAHDETVQIGEDEFRSTLASFASQATARAAAQQIEARCENATRSNDSPANFTSWSIGCRYTYQGVTQNAEVRMLANTKSVFFLIGSWSTDWGREKTLAFFRSFHPVVDANEAKPSTGEPVAISVATLQRGFARAIQ